MSFRIGLPSTLDTDESCDSNNEARRFVKKPANPRRYPRLQKGPSAGLATLKGLAPTPGAKGIACTNHGIRTDTSHLRLVNEWGGLTMFELTELGTNPGPFLLA